MIDRSCWDLGSPLSQKRTHNDSLGIKIGQNPLKTTLTVLSVADDGLIPQWNAANKSLQIEAGDSIVDVNGVYGRSDRMFAVRCLFYLCIHIWQVLIGVVERNK